MIVIIGTVQHRADYIQKREFFVKVLCVWEHNGDDTLLYATNYPGAYTRGENLQTAIDKMSDEILSYQKWSGDLPSANLSVEIIQEQPSKLEIRDADSDVLFLSEKAPLYEAEYTALKQLTLKSAADFLKLYHSIPNKSVGKDLIRNTFYGQTPRTAEEMYTHTKNVNAYYFGEIGVDANNDGDILQCRKRGFEMLERNSDFLSNPVVDGSFGEYWTLRKMLRRFIWHDRIHGKALYRMAVAMFGKESIPDVFCFE